MSIVKLSLLTFSLHFLKRNGYVNNQNSLVVKCRHDQTEHWLFPHMKNCMCPLIWLIVKPNMKSIQINTFGASVANLNSSERDVGALKLFHSRIPVINISNRTKCHSVRFCTQLLTARVLIFKAMCDWSFSSLRVDTCWDATESKERG